ncbi:MAG: ATP-binding protein [Fidelibacterota bacterium]
MTFVSAVCISIGSLVMAVSAWRTRHIVELLEGQKFSHRWHLLYYLMLAFIVGYIGSLILLLLEGSQGIQLLTGFVFLGGALFVWLVVQTGHSTLKDLSTTTVSRNYVENIIQSMADTLIVVNMDKNKRIETVNAATMELLNYSRNELEGEGLATILSNPESETRLINDILHEGHIVDREVEYKRKDGTTIPVLFSGSALKDMEGNVVGIVCVGQDITERKRAAEKLEAANGMKDLLLDIITHDLKNPAGVIQGIVKILQEKDPDKPEYTILKTSSENLITVIQNASTLSKAAMEEALSKEDLDLVPMINAVVSNFDSALRHKEITVTTDLPDSLTIKANPIIDEVFKNYLSNAIKYAAHGKKIDIYSRKEPDNTVKICFRDYGDTITAEHRDRIFIRKAQMQEHTAKGTGLGLAIVKRIVESHGGTVWVEPNTPQGNIFCVRLPRK